MTGHEDLETLAALAEGTLEPRVALRAREHMAACRSCTAAYADAVRYRAAWLSRPEAFAYSEAASNELLRSAKLQGRPVRYAPVWLAAAAAIAIVALGGSWLVARDRDVRAGIALSPAVCAALQSYSSHGLVVPGAERFAAGTAPEMRSGMAESTPDLEREVDSLIARYEHGGASPELAAQLVVSLIASSDLEAARDYAREGLRNYPGDARLLVACASVLDRGDDLAGAEAMLREALGRAPGDPLVALDLALVLRQRGEHAESNALLKRVARCRAPSLAERAARELNTTR